ncbi:MAG: adenylate/guanylate cyclase domain-containing protein [Acidimicrobiia bacterium]|jgi:class 3 adenylate cyclase
MEFGLGGRPPTRYVEAASGNLAYQVFGSGERDIMFVTGGISNIDAVWDEPSAVRFFDRLGGLGRVIQYDMRGSGVSDPIPGETIWMPLEDNMTDVLSILDAAGSEQAVVYGDTEGGLSAMMVAATNPERVSALVLVNCEPRFLEAEDYPIGISEDEAASLSRKYVAQHGTTGAMLNLTAPSVAGDQRFRAWWTRYQRLAVPLGLVKRTFDWFSVVDVRAVLPLIRVPTLVVARRDARFHRLVYGRYLADHIDGAVLRVVEGADTLPFHAGDFGPVLDHVEEFLTGRSDAPRVDRVLATVLFTDIVGSTAMAASMGDERWLDLLQEHDRIARAQLARFRGREITMTGDGCVATFDGPGRAVACAAAMVEQMAQIGLTVRAGIHTGEVEYRADDIGGLGVHIASRVMSQAESGGILVSGTVKDLVVGSGLEFRSRGTFDLKGVPGEWQLFELESLG